MPKIDDNTIYRLLNNPWMNWRKFLMGFAKQFVRKVKEKGDQNTGITCFVVDDTDLEKSGKTIEYIGRIFNHVSGKSILGLKMLLLSFWDGKSLISVDFSLHREKGKNGNYGLTKKERRAQFKKKRDVTSPGYKRVEELDVKKNENAIAMIRRAVKSGLIASYVLMDSWFVNDSVIKGIRAIKKGAMHILGMCKIDKRNYSVGKRKMNAHQLITKYERKKGKYSRKYKSRYISLVVDYKGETVRLFFIQYNHSKKWTLILTTDLTLSFVQAIEIYQIRWSIEVLYKECKQYLRLGGSQNTDFDGQIADTTLALITHTVLTLQKRFGSYETMGELFRETQQYLLELTLWERLLRVFYKMILQLFEIIDIDLEEVISTLVQDDEVSRKLRIMLSALNDLQDNDQNLIKNDNELLLAS
ncbi:MAG: transposase [Lentimicrobium sp.]|nr:transposase [Lentimicrobium sp.]